MKSLIVLGLCFLLSPGSPARAQATDNPFAGAPTQYSVDVITTRPPDTRITMKMYADGDKRRTEQETHNGGLVVILRSDRSLVYTVLQSRKAYRVSPLDPSILKSFDLTQSAKQLGTTYEKVANEPVGGEMCGKYAVSPGGETAQNSSATANFVWISDLTHLPVRSEAAGAITEWKNLRVGPQDSNLFEPPTDYKRLDEN